MTEALRFLWFAPNAGIWPSFAMEHTVADALVGAGHEVLMVQCDGVLDAYCPVMTTRGLLATSATRSKARVCRDCRQAARIGETSGRYATSALSALLTAADADAVDRQVAAVNKENWAELECDGLSVGRFAAYTTLLNLKTASITDSPESWAQYLCDLRNSLLMMRALPRLMQGARPTHAVVYNALYPANRIFAEMMLQAGVPLLNLSFGASIPRRHATLAVFDGIRASQTLVDSEAFRKAMEVPCTPVEVALVEEHLRKLMDGDDPWVYSAAASDRSAEQVRQHLGLRASSPIATVIISSPDESRSSMLADAEFLRDPEQGYAPPSEYLEECLQLARATPDVDFVFRMHPRMAPNKRESIHSPDLAVMDALLVDRPSNVVVNYPADGLSLYDLVAVSSVAVNHTSTAGLEFLVFGIPVLQYDPARAGAYPLDFSYAVARRDRPAFRQQLTAALDSGWSFDRCIAVFRWLACRQIRSVVHLEPWAQQPNSEPVGVPEDPGLPRVVRLGRFLPTSVKESVALALEGRRRRADIATRSLDPEALPLFLRHAVTARVEGEVWEPPMLLPQVHDSTAERAAVLAAVVRLAGNLAVTDSSGVGVIAAVRA